MNLRTIICISLFLVIAVSCNESVIQTDPVLEAQTKTNGLKGALIVGTYYVSKAGNDFNSGRSASNSFLTIQKAANVVNPGDTVIVDDGVYTATSEAIVMLSRSGTSVNPIIFKSKNKWGAVLDGRNNTNARGFILNNVSYIILENFEFRAISGWAIVAEVGSHHLKIRGNHIHDIGRICTNTYMGLVGTYLNNVSYVFFEQNVTHDIGRFAKGENGCTTTNEYYKNHDHGLYLNGVNNVIVRNNIFFNIKRGQGIHIYSYNNLNSSYLRIENNTFAYGNPYHPAGHMMIWGSLNNSLIANNIFYSQLGSALQIYQGSMAYSNVEIKNNITYGGKGTINTGTAVGVVISNNLNNTDPEMTDPGSYNFTLTASSPAINRGFDVGLTTDYSTNPIQGLPDIGAYEFSDLNAEPY